MDIGEALELPACHDKMLCLGEKGARVSACVPSDITHEHCGHTHPALEKLFSSNLDSVWNAGSY
jgi:hypothetical protein